jgi:hypothetical protein
VRVPPKAEARQRKPVASGGPPVKAYVVVGQYSVLDQGVRAVAFTRQAAENFIATESPFPPRYGSQIFEVEIIGTLQSETNAGGKQE